MKTVMVVFLGTLVIIVGMSSWHISNSQQMLIKQQQQILDSQKTQMKQQFHSDGIALVSLFGDDGLRALFEDRISTPKEKYVTGLLVQRFVVAYWIRNAYSKTEWQKLVVDDGKATFRLPALRHRWQELKHWYPPEVQEFIDGLMKG